MSDKKDQTLASRRHVLRACGGAAVLTGGLTLLSACGADDDSPAPGATPTPAQTSAQPVVPGPSYTATDADRLNFALQINYLIAAYLFRGVWGTDLPASLTTGSGTSGTVTGGSQVSFAATALASNMREIAYDVQAHITYLRRVLGSATTARPAISIAGGASGPFQAIASTTAFPVATPFDPYASETNYLIGAVALTGTFSGALIDITRLLSDAGQRDSMGGMLAAATQHDVVLRLELFVRGQTDNALYTKVNQMSGARNTLANDNLDQGVGDRNFFNALSVDDRGSALRRTPEQTLNVLYATRNPVTSGAFFPAGINGVIRSSGSRAG